MTLVRERTSEGLRIRNPTPPKPPTEQQRVLSGAQAA